MKKTIYTSVLFFLTMFSLKAQNDFNPTKKWFVGTEIGYNSVLLNTKNYKKSFEYGAFVEYYYLKNFSVTIRVKSYKKGYNESPLYKTTQSDILSIPINLKWEFKLIHQLKVTASLGLAFVTEKNYKYEEDSEYKDKIENTDTTLNSGMGINYFLSKKIGIFIYFENYLNFWKNKGKTKPLFLYNKNYSHLNFGIKYRIN